ncbi:dihydrofolate reductase [Candidatus Legionella polyplacis]|uniref:dihydrofolate reductase n=1 Tax=Candidatus Legionella polyplacis TaxID=2005262 RepID=A0ABZ2GX52_9GAMM|nr:dihydrofolate reductase [Candidatus Legionella polyplacis]
MIAVVDKRGALGKNNSLLCYLPDDLKIFKRVTMGLPVIMGRNTFISIGEKPLVGRLNLVLSNRNFNFYKSKYEKNNVKILSSLEDTLNVVKDYKESVVIGGAMVYRKFFPFVSKIYLTVIHNIFKADVYFPKFNINNWKISRKILKLKDDFNPFDFTFYCYVKR